MTVTAMVGNCSLSLSHIGDLWSWELPSEFADDCNAMIGEGVCSCFYESRTHLGGVSLNRSEQQLFEYIESNREERQFWEYKVRGFNTQSAARADAARLIEGELWRYYKERAGVVPKFKQVAEREGLHRVSMQNLAEYLLRLWVPLPAQAKRAAQF
jgi:hypothetical protein